MPLNTHDTSEQRRAETEIRHFQEALGPFVIAAEKTRMPMAFTDATTADDRIVFANDSMVALTGYKRHELIGRSLTSMIVKRTDRGAPDAKTQQPKEKIETETDTMFRRKDGSDFCAAMLKCSVPDQAGIIVQNFISLVDLTHYKKSETALRLSEHRFRMAARTTGLGIADIDFLAHEEHWSAELRSLLGVTDCAPASLATYSALIHPDDREVAVDLRRRSLAGDISPNNDAVFRIIRPNDGEYRWIEAERHVELDDAGSVVRILVINRDITTEKTTQDRVAWAATHDSVTASQIERHSGTRLKPLWRWRLSNPTSAAFC
ncbi:MAG: PAS domain S-box protein [Pseudomonadota bacterium]